MERNIKSKIKKLEEENKKIMKKMNKTNNQNMWNSYWRLVRSNGLLIGRLKSKLRKH